MDNNNKKKAINSTKDHPNVKARQVPQNYEAERAVLGCILLDNNPSLLITDGLAVGDFFSPIHRCVYEAMLALAHADLPVDIVTLMQQLDTDGNREKVGGLSFVSSLTDSVPSSGNFRYYRDIIKKNGLLRHLIEECSAVIEHCYAGDPTDNALQIAESAIYGVAEKQDKSTLKPLQPELLLAIKQMEKLQEDPKAMRGIPTPFKGLNYLLGGLQRSDLILIAARPGQGKTSIGMNLISHAAMTHARTTDSGKHNPYRCAVFSLEMPSEQLAKRMLCSVAKVDMHKSNSGTLSSSEWQDVFLAKSKLDQAKIYIDDSSLTTPVEILSKCRRLKRENGLDLIMIDYLQLMSSGKRTESRQQEISDITRTLKIAAKELDVPILLLSQMSRDIEKRTDKKPQMSDLRESGAIEQDADIIMFIYRKHEANDETVDETTRNLVELHIVKHRNGSTGNIKVMWKGSTVSFVDYTDGDASFAPKAKQQPQQEQAQKQPKTKTQSNATDQIFGPPPPETDSFEDMQALDQAIANLERSGL